LITIFFDFPLHDIIHAILLLLNHRVTGYCVRFLGVMRLHFRDILAKIKGSTTFSALIPASIHDTIISSVAVNELVSLPCIFTYLPPLTRKFAMHFHLFATTYSAKVYSLILWIRSGILLILHFQYPHRTLILFFF
jgi:hypothetical protein